MSAQPVLRPFLSYYGGKWTLAKRYPDPLYDHIVEPFAGSAGYSVRHYRHRVTLIDSYEPIVGAWDYLIKTPAEEIRRLPDLEHGQPVSDLKLPQEARWLIGWLINKATTRPGVTMSAWARNPEWISQFWGARIRERLATQAEYIRHWRVILGDYRSAPDIGPVTWFVDPPYQGRAGRRYAHSDIDYSALAEWCKELNGQAIVCEHQGADWLPFADLGVGKSTRGCHDAGHQIKNEAIWTNAGCGK